MLEIAFDTHRGTFHLQIESRFSADWTVIFGPSGSGKSTLLRLLAGLDRTENAGSEARVVHNTTVLTDSTARIWLGPGKRNMAMVTQRPALFPHLSVEANVAYGLAKLDRNARKDTVTEMLELAGALHLADRRPRDLSGGEAQRIALARALAPKPRLLLLDEPFSALDGAASDALLDRLHQWVREHEVQTVMATHEASDAFATGAEVALLREGRLCALGPADQVLAEERRRLLDRLAETGR